MKQPSINCEQVDELLIDYADDQLTGAEKANVQAHLQLCSRCAAQLSSFKQTRQTMAALEFAPAPASGLESLMAYAQKAADRAKEDTESSLLSSIFATDRAATRAGASPAAKTPKPGWMKWLVPAFSAGGLMAGLLVLVVTVKSSQRAPTSLAPVSAQKAAAVNEQVASVVSNESQAAMDVDAKPDSPPAASLSQIDDVTPDSVPRKTAAISKFGASAAATANRPSRGSPGSQPEIANQPSKPSASGRLEIAKRQAMDKNKDAPVELKKAERPNEQPEISDEGRVAYVIPPPAPSVAWSSPPSPAPGGAADDSKARQRKSSAINRQDERSFKENEPSLSMADREAARSQEDRGRAYKGAGPASSKASAVAKSEPRPSNKISFVSHIPGVRVVINGSRYALRESQSTVIDLPVGSVPVTFEGALSCSVILEVSGQESVEEWRTVEVAQDRSVAAVSGDGRYRRRNLSCR